jgi:hypothetical protein
VLTIPKSATYQDIKKINIMYATNFNEADNSSLDKLLKIMAPFDKEIHCVHIDIYDDPYKQSKVDKLNQLFKKEYSKHKIECKFSKPKRSLFYKLFYPSNFEKLVSTEKIPMLIFPV